MADRYVIGIDSSTTACKAIAWDRHGHAVAHGRSSYPTLQPHPTWYEQKAEDWWNGFCIALQELFLQVKPEQVDALCITNQRESFVPVNRECGPLRNAVLWLDERCLHQLQWLKNHIGAEALHRITGKHLSMIPALPKIVWMMEHELDIVRRTHQFLDAHAFLIYHLTGTFATSTACADPFGLMDMRKNTWSEELITQLRLRVDQFPELYKPGELIGKVKGSAGDSTGLTAGLPIIAGAGDGQCAGLGVNAISKGKAYLNLGTAVVSGVLSARYLFNRAFRTLYAPIPDHYFLETCLKGGTFTISWFIDKFARDLCGKSYNPEELLESEAAGVPPGSLGLILVPYWHNAMGPYWDPAASGITVGWTGSHGREHFYRAILEGIAFEQRLMSDAVAEAIGQSIDEFIILGGGSQSNLWCQIIADVTGIRVTRTKTSEATCLGAGMLAAAASGWYTDVFRAAQSMSSMGDRFHPRPRAQAIYNKLYPEIYKPLFPKLQAILDHLTELTNEN